MIANRLRCAGIALVLLLIPASRADAFEWLDRMLGINNTSYYAPAAVGPASYPQQACCSQPTVSYMPQTCYRTVYQMVPVTSYYPASTCDPCTGCQRTVMRPVTSYVAQASVVPYTSYRAVVANYAPPCGSGCAPMARTVAYPGTGGYLTP